VAAAHDGPPSRLAGRFFAERQPAGGALQLGDRPGGLEHFSLLDARLDPRPLNRGPNVPRRAPRVTERTVQEIPTGLDEV